MNSSNVELHLTIEQYEFPELEFDKYDSNWLLIIVSFSTPAGKWTYRDPALLTWEVQELIEWLKLGATKQNVKRIYFTEEPCLSFDITAYDTEEATLQIYLGFGFVPPWIQQDSLDEDDRFVLELQVGFKELAQAAHDLETELKRFPTRTQDE